MNMVHHVMTSKNEALVNRMRKALANGFPLFTFIVDQVDDGWRCQCTYNGTKKLKFPDYSGNLIAITHFARGFYAAATTEAT